MVRRLQTSLSIELSRKRGQTRLFRVEWQSHQKQSVRFAYQYLLRGRLPSPLPGVRISGVFESVRQKSIRVALNVFDWMILRREKSTRQIERASLTPDGHLLIERADSLERLRETRRSRQLASVLLRDIEERERKSTNLRWSLAREGRFDRRRLRQWLRLGLHSRILDSATLPGRKRFPLRLRFLLVSEYSSAGLLRIRRASREDWWMTLIRVLEILAPERYGRPNHWRDWIDFPEVREAIDRDPVQSHLATRYPISGRRSVQRRQVVSEYLRARRFLDLLDGWKQGDRERLLRLLSARLDLPAFLFFSLLCPEDMRRGAAALQGDLEYVWGDPSLLLE